MTHAERILRLLSDGKPHSHHELYALGTVAHSRISDLRAKGHQISQWRDGDLYLYRLSLPAPTGRPSHGSLPVGAGSDRPLSGAGGTYVERDSSAAPTGHTSSVWRENPIEPPASESETLFAMPRRPAWS